METKIEQFLNYLNIERNYGERTIKEYKHDLSIFERFLDKDVLETDKEDLRNFLGHLKTERNYSPSAVLRKLATLRSFFKFCLREDYVNKNPLDYITAPKNVTKLPVFLTDDEVDQLINASYSKTYSIKGKRNHAIIMLLLGGGLRVSELVNLKMRDIEFNNNSFIIKIKGKGNKERMIPIMNRVKDVLEMWLKERPSSECENIFINLKTLMLLSVDTIQYLVRTTSIEAGIKKRVTPHKLRHTFATNLMKNNANIVSIQELLGHSNLNTTRIYTHVTLQDVQNAVAMLSYN
jgi:site-specific recombinase XerD